jgi:hypothetical protein
VTPSSPLRTLSLSVTFENQKVEATDIVAEKQINTPISHSASSTTPITKTLPNESERRKLACSRFGVNPSPIRVHMFQHFLSSHPDKKLVSELIHDLTEGVRIGYNGPRDKFRPSPNLPILPEHEKFIDTEIQKEVDAKRRIGPFDEPPFPNFIISPIGVVTKRLSSKLRMIHHLSWPRHQSADSDSINEHISPEDCETKLQSFDDAVHMLSQIHPKRAHSERFHLLNQVKW